MENQSQQNQVSKQLMTQEQVLAEILENSRKTKNYMKWQLIITVGLVVIPLLATLFVIPFALKSLTSVYSSAGLESLTGGANGNTSAGIQDLINQYTQ